MFIYNQEKNVRNKILNLHQYFNLHVCLSFRPSFRPVPSVPSHLRVSLCLEFQRPSQTAAEQGKAELRILYFKTTWSEFQKPSQIAAKRGKAELRILDFKTIWSEFHHLPIVGPKQLCALAHLGCTRAAGTS